MPSLSTSLCMVSGPEALPLLRNLTNLVSVCASTSGQICSDLDENLVPQEDKITYDYLRAIY